MSYCLDTKSDEGTLRVLLYDITTVSSPTRLEDYFFEDAELTSSMDLNSDDLWITAADLCRAMAAHYAKTAYRIGLGKTDIDIDFKRRPEFYLGLAKLYDGKSIGSSSVSEYVDSFAIDVTGTGFDVSEYIGDS